LHKHPAEVCPQPGFTSFYHQITQNNPLIFPEIDIPLDKIYMFPYVSCIDVERAKHAIPIGATGISRQEQCPTNEIETDKKDAR
jgi:hypothetical protein